MEGPIKVCEYCGKVDVTQEHIDNCNYEIGRDRAAREENLWK